MFAYATGRYFSAMKRLQAGRFQPNTTGVLGLAAVCTLVCGASVTAVLRPGEHTTRTSNG